MKAIIYISVLGFFIFSTSCATILTGTKQKITIDSSPQGAEILIDGDIVGKTPAKVRVKKNVNNIIDNGKDIYLELEGYKKREYELKTEINPVAILNLFNALGWAIDAATGAAIRYAEYNYFELTPLEDKTSTTTEENVEIPEAESNEEQNKDIDEKYEKLAKLKKLLEDELITQEDYDNEKAKILAE